MQNFSSIGKRIHASKKMAFFTHPVYDYLKVMS